MGTPSNETVFIAHLSPDGTQAQTVKTHLQNTARRAEAFGPPLWRTGTGPVGRDTA